MYGDIMTGRFTLLLALFLLFGPAAANTIEPQAQLFYEASSLQQGILEIRLRFQQTEGDFVIFYDRTGEPIRLRYRSDFSDRSRDKEIAKLAQGMLYRVQYRPANPVMTRGSASSKRVIRKTKPKREGELIRFFAVIPESMVF